MRNPIENSILNLMYRGTTTIENFNWDQLTTVPMIYLISPEDVNEIEKIIMSPRLSGNLENKKRMIDDIMHYRGFTRYACGTNRVVYIHPAAPNAVFKVALDVVGLKDNPAEYYNQQFLKPYCCKVFECSQNGTIASFEKVDRITTFEEFYTIADDYFYLVSRKILGKYVMEDIGVDYFMNVGIRLGYGPVILDFPYLFELDGRKLECGSQLDDGTICGGEIDYDHGFNKLICKKCGRLYRARDLAKPPKESKILVREKGARRMRLVITRGDEVLKVYDTTVERDHLSKNDSEVVPRGGKIKVNITRNVTEEPKEEEKVEQAETKTVVEEPVKTTEETPVVKSTKVININMNKSAEECKPAIPVTIVKEETKKTEPVKQEEKKVVKKEEKKVEEKPVVDSPAKKIISLTLGNKPTDKIVMANSIEPTIKISIGKEKEEPKVEEEAKTVEQEVVAQPEAIAAVSFGDDIVEETPVVEETNVEEPKVVEEIRLDRPAVINEDRVDRSAVVEEVKDEEPEVTPEPEVVAEPEPVVEPVKEEKKSKTKKETSSKKTKKKTEEQPVEEKTTKKGKKKSAPVEEVVEPEPEVVEEVKVEEPEVVAEPEVIEEPVVEVEPEVVEEPVVKTETTIIDVPEEELTVVEENTEAEDEFEEDVYDIRFVTTLPTTDEAEPDVFYCLAVEDNLDLSAYDGVTDPTLIDESLFDIYLLVDGYGLARVNYNYDKEQWEYYEEPEYVIDGDHLDEDAMIQQLKKSGKKKSLDDFVE